MDTVLLIDKLRTEAQSFVDNGRDWHVRVAAANLMRAAADELARLVAEANPVEGGDRQDAFIVELR